MSRKIGPATQAYTRHVVESSRMLVMNEQGRLVERLVERIGPERSIAQDVRLCGSTRRILVPIQQ